jgi:hypothetical protein
MKPGQRLLVRILDTHSSDALLANHGLTLTEDGNTNVASRACAQPKAKTPSVSPTDSANGSTSKQASLHVEPGDEYSLDPNSRDNDAPLLFAAATGGQKKDGGAATKPVGSAASATTASAHPAAQTNPSQAPSASPSSSSGDSSGNDAGDTAAPGAPTANPSSTASAATLESQSTNDSSELLLNREIVVGDNVSTIIFRYNVVDCTNPTLVIEAHPFTISVDEGYHFLEAGLLVPLVLNGNRQIVGTVIPNTSLQALHVKEDLHVAFGIAFNIYPFAVANSYSIFDRGVPWYEPLRGIGFQGGTNIDFTSNSFSEWYIGLGYRLMKGASLSGGIAMLRGQFLPAGYVDGMLVPSSGIQQDTKYMFRPYVGVTLSTDILGTLSNVFANITKASSTTPQLPTSGKN